MKNLISGLLILILMPLYSQDFNQKGSSAGILSVGVRSSYSVVNDGKWQKPAFGTGGQFRLKFGDRVNTEWFIDYLTADLSNYGWRADTHIGWSVMFYVLKNPNPKVQPYVLAGHCFEYLKFTDNLIPSNFAERWSASIQGGVGTHINLTSRFDVSFTAQYMVHFGTKIIASNVDGMTTFNKVKGSGIHDHILLHMSINYKISDLW